MPHEMICRILYGLPRTIFRAGVRRFGNDFRQYLGNRLPSDPKSLFTAGPTLFPSMLTMYPLKYTKTNKTIIIAYIPNVVKDGIF